MPLPNSLLTLPISLLTLPISIRSPNRILMSLPNSMIKLTIYAQKVVEVFLTLLRKNLVFNLQYLSHNLFCLRNRSSCLLIKHHRTHNGRNQLIGHYLKFRPESTLLQLKKKFNDYPRTGSVVGYNVMLTVAHVLKKAKNSSPCMRNSANEDS